MFISLLEEIDICQDPPCFNIGIFGNDGSGKSTFVRNLLAFDILEENHHKTMIYTKEKKFQAQLYEKEDHKTYSNSLLFQEDNVIHIHFVDIKNNDQYIRENLKHIDLFIFVIDGIQHIQYVDDICNQSANQGILIEYILILNNKNNKVIEKNIHAINEHNRIIFINLNERLINNHQIMEEINQMKTRMLNRENYAEKIYVDIIGYWNYYQQEEDHQESFIKLLLLLKSVIKHDTYGYLLTKDYVRNKFNEITTNKIKNIGDDVYKEILNYYNLDQFLYNFAKIPSLFEVNKIIKTTLKK
jgi:GTPase SAR1 family protein